MSGAYHVPPFFSPVCASRAVSPGPVGVKLGGVGIALFRDARGRVGALSDVCPHRFAPLSAGRVRPDGRIACPYHGWNFDASGSGRSPSQPALSGCDTTAYEAVERYGHVWVAGAKSDLAIPDLTAGGFVYAGAHETATSAPADLLLARVAESPALASFRRLFGFSLEERATTWARANLHRPLEERATTWARANLHGPREGGERVSYAMRDEGSGVLEEVRAGEVHISWETRAAPLRAVATLERPGLSVRLACFVVPETAASTRVVVLVFARGVRARMAAPLARLLSARTGDGGRALHAGADLRAAARARIARLALTPAGSAPATWTGFRRFVVKRRVDEGASGIVSFYLAPIDGAPLAPYHAGQHLTFRLAVPGRAPVVRCYSLSDKPRPDTYRVSIKRIDAGVASSFLHDGVREGHELDVKAPGGHFYADAGAAAPVVLLAGGVGVTPLVAMLHAILESRPTRAIWLFYGIRERAHVFRPDELDALVRAHPSLRVVYRVSSDGERVTIDALRATLPSNANAYDFYLCGPAPMMQALTSGLLDWGVPLEKIHVEAFGPKAVKKIARAPSQNGAASSASPKVTFARSGKSVRWDPRCASLLELAEANDVAIESGCCVGSCSTCKTRLLSGAVTYTTDPGEPPSAAEVYMCISVPRTDVEVDA